MRKTKENTQITKDQILEGAVRCFSEKGYDWTTIERVAKAVGVSRGTVYWHFPDKKELYRASVDYAMEQADMVAYARSQSLDISLEDCFCGIFMQIIHDNVYVDFYYRAIAFAANREEFTDTLTKMQAMKQRLLDFIAEQCRQYMELHGITGEEPGFYADSLFLILEGMFMVKNLNVTVDLSPDRIRQYIHSAIERLLRKGGECK